MILKNLRKNPKKGMTLIELMISMAIFALIMTMIMTTVHSMTVARIKNMNRLVLTDELYFFSEQLFTAIKEGGTLDYEEYWNRRMVGIASGSGHYTNPTGVGNFGRDGNVSKVPSNYDSNYDYGGDLYLCRSIEGHKMGTDGCINGDLNTQATDQAGKFQRFGQYAEQFWDYNSNADIDGGDQNDDKSIIGDEDDKNILDGPEVFSGAIHELYLKNSIQNQPTRTFFRWNIEKDPNSPAGTTCEIKKDGEYFIAGDNCIGNIQILKLNGFDRGLQHDATGSGAYDGKIDTWVCEKGWNCQGENIHSVGSIATGLEGEWKNLFPNSITVRKFRLDAFPKKDPWLAAEALDCVKENSLHTTTCVSPFIHPYIRFSLELGFSHGARRTISGENPIISISTTVNLDDFR